MKYLRTTSPEPVAEVLVLMIRSALGENKSVLWLLSGGSSIDVAVIAAQQLGSQPNLVIMQVDERFGPVGHNNSNWQRLIDKGFKPDNFPSHPILTGKGIEQTTKDYSDLLDRELNKAGFRIGLFGIGADGHTAGMLPQSIAAKEQHELVVHYDAPDFNRITTTSPVIDSLDVAVVYALGQDKEPALRDLRQDKSVANQPAQALKRAKEVYVYTDLQGEI